MLFSHSIYICNCENSPGFLIRVSEVAYHVVWNQNKKQTTFLLEVVLFEIIIILKPYINFRQWMRLLSVLEP